MITGTFQFNDLNHFRQFFIPYSSRRYKTPNPLYVGNLIVTYAITCLSTGKTYVGSTENFYNRWYKHVWLCKNKQSKNDELQASFDLHGIDDFTIEILNTFESTDGLLLEEECAALNIGVDRLMNHRIGSRWISNAPYSGAVSRFPLRGASKVPGRNQKARWFDHQGAAQ